MIEWLSVGSATMTHMATIDPLAPFQWLNAFENQADPLGEIFSVGFFRNLAPSQVVRRFSKGDDSGQESDFEELNDRMVEFLGKTGGGHGGGHVGVFRAGVWSVAIEPVGWWMTDRETLPELSRDCEVLAITVHGYAEHSLEYAIDGTIVTGHRLEYPHDRWGCDPDRLNDYMRELGMEVELGMTDNDHIYDPDEDESDSDYSTCVPRAFALAAKVTGVSFTADMLDQPLIIGPIAYRWSPSGHTTA
ncbi:DUF6461 domain-containing protein [Nocardia sp. NPDC046473]|uniref:DUF6461 domain-containing protein n=1 Tax=Nocardia sp. NPDC046473 TaxID=3155733 RepID=UPI0033CC2935